METFFATLASMSLTFTWVSGAQLMALQGSCGGEARYAAVAHANAATLDDASLAPFGKSEHGWRIYAPQMAATIGTACAPDTKRFAARLADWQRSNRLAATGTVDTATLGRFKHAWQEQRPFLDAFARGCPPPAADARLAAIGAREGWRGKQAKLDARALADLRRMIEAARAADPRIGADRELLTVVSAFRSPAYDAAKCAAGANCNGIAKAKCSAHRTGTAVDLFVGAAPGHSPVDSADANRLYQSQTPAYRWLVKNAGRFGFVNYVFEPWHWEWMGERAHAAGMTAK